MRGTKDCRFNEAKRSFKDAWICFKEGCKWLWKWANARESCCR